MNSKLCPVCKAQRHTEISKGKVSSGKETIEICNICFYPVGNDWTE